MSLVLLLKSLSLLREARVIHCDLNLENILLIESFWLADLKLIDFGSAFKEDHTVYTYIQSVLQVSGGFFYVYRCADETGSGRLGFFYVYRCGYE
ncbi:hypothetical protein M758_UG299700 [Ceratodon purpureus]|nr:hypothetical protein M758_UG299700 [Ceratodon purpureus]